MIRLFTSFMEGLYGLTGDWGIAIILLTVISKIILLPISLKTKKNSRKQLEFNVKVKELEEKYKNNEDKLQKELMKLYEKNTGMVMGMFSSLLQIPIVSSLYMTIMRMPVEVSTVLVPWVKNMKMVDTSFVLPIVYLIINLMPTIMGSVSFLKGLNYEKGSKAGVILSGVFSLFIISRAPVSVGIYFITSSLFGFIEDFIYKLYMRDKVIA